MPTWNELLRKNPAHSKNYAARWDRFEAAGDDIVGEARLVDAMVARHARILDAGCGQGRIGGYLAAVGHEVTGVDLDPYLIEVAKQKYPAANATWLVGDLAKDPLPKEPFDLIVSAGNVVTFLAEKDRLPALTALANALADNGRLVVGFGAGRGWSFEQFLSDAAAAGLRLQQRFATWSLDPFEEDSTFMVSVLVRAA